MPVLTTDTNGTVSSVGTWLQHAIEIDYRALAAFRIGAALVILTDLTVRAGSMAAHYTDAGAVPRSVVWELAGTFPLSIHMISGGMALQVALFVVAVAAALALLVGYRTRLATVASWALLLSLHARNPWVVNSGDGILLAMLFWGMFLPLGRKWSVDARGTERGDTSTVSMWTFGVILQICFIYLFSVGYKTSPIWRSDFTAIYYALQLDAYATPLGAWLASFGQLPLKVVTGATLFIEGLVPLLVFSPLRTRACRTIAALTFIGFHIGLGLTMYLGLFPAICIAAWLLVLPTPFWDSVEAGWRRIRGLAGRPTARLDVQTPTAGGMRMLITHGVIPLLLIQYVFLIHLQRLWPVEMLWLADGPTWEAIRKPADAIRYPYRWSMFAPNPATHDGWYEVRGRTAAGRSVDVLNVDLQPLEGKPADVAATYANQRWRKFLFEHYRSQTFAGHREHLVRYLSERWNRLHPADPVMDVEVTFMLEVTPPPGEHGTIEPRPLYPPRDGAGG